MLCCYNYLVLQMYCKTDEHLKLTSPASNRYLHEHVVPLYTMVCF